MPEALEHLPLLLVRVGLKGGQDRVLLLQQNVLLLLGLGILRLVIGVIPLEAVLLLPQFLVQLTTLTFRAL